MILNKANIDSDKDVFAARYVLEQMDTNKAELSATITTLQTQVDSYELSKVDLSNHTLPVEELLFEHHM